MGIILNGSKPSKIIYNGAESALYFNGSKIWPEVAPDPPLPPIAAKTVRVRTSDGNVPNNGDYDTATLVTGTTDVYDVYDAWGFAKLLDGATNVVEILGVNPGNYTEMEYTFRGCTSLTTIQLFDTSNVVSMRFMFNGCTSLTTVPLFNTSSVTNMTNMFQDCTSLTTVPLFDTSNVTIMYCMFRGCTSLTTVPLFDTSKATDVEVMFRDCTNVESGALALYNQMSTQATPPSSHTRTFMNCGSNTTTGAAELAQIPSDWK